MSGRMYCENTQNDETALMQPTHSRSFTGLSQAFEVSSHGVHRARTKILKALHKLRAEPTSTKQILCVIII